MSNKIISALLVCALSLNPMLIADVAGNASITVQWSNQTKALLELVDNAITAVKDELLHSEFVENTTLFEVALKNAADGHLELKDTIRIFYLGKMINKKGIVSISFPTIHEKLLFQRMANVQSCILLNDTWTFFNNVQDDQFNHDELKISLFKVHEILKADEHLRKNYCDLLLREFKEGLRYKGVKAVIVINALLWGSVFVAFNPTLITKAISAAQEYMGSSVASMKEHVKESGIGKFFGQDSASQAAKKETIALLTQQAVDSGILNAKRANIVALDKSLKNQQMVLQQAQKIKNYQSTKEVQAKINKMKRELKGAYDDFYASSSEYLEKYPDNMHHLEAFLDVDSYVKACIKYGLAF